jgi:hypothetical protein
MTTKEFSNAFDTLLNSYANTSNFGDPNSKVDIVLDEYEKSLFLTEAQDQVIIELYSGRNEKSASFEKTEELRANLRNLIDTKQIEKSTEAYEGITNNSQFFKLPSNLLFITYEAAVIEDDAAGCINGNTLPVIPVTQDEFHRTKNNPFKRPNNRKVLRLDNGLDIVEIVSKYNISNYIVRYLSKPTPIVLTDLSEIDAFPEVNGKETNCKLDSELHRPILERAVLLAINSKGIQNRK